jgi:hypothetical protein
VVTACGDGKKAKAPAPPAAKAPTWTTAPATAVAPPKKISPKAKARTASPKAKTRAASPKAKAPADAGAAPKRTKPIVTADPDRLLTVYRSSTGFKAATWLICEALMDTMREPTKLLARGMKWPKVNPVRQVAAKLLGISPNTVKDHLKFVKKAIEATSEGCSVKLPVVKLGPRKKGVDQYRAEWPDFYEQIGELVKNAQRQGTTLSVHKLNRLVTEANPDDDFTYNMMRYYLKKLGFRYGHITRSIKSGRTKPSVVEWLKRYCARRHQLNVEGQAGNHPDKIDAFLDESALWRDDGGNLSWYHDDNVWAKVNVPKEKWMVVQVIFAWWEDGTRKAEVYDECLFVWQVWDGKKCSHRVNMTGAKFEDWVEDVCKFTKAKFRGKDLCWHMDNASYHKKKGAGQHTLPDFDNEDDVTKLVSWLVQHTLPTDPYGDFDSFFEDHLGNAVEPDLELVRDMCKSHSAAHKERVKQILGTYGYKCAYTAPYWPQSMPVELSWSNMKWCWRNEYDEDDRDDPERFVRTFFAGLENDEPVAWVTKTDKWCQAVVERSATVLKSLELELLG